MTRHLFKLVWNRKRSSGLIFLEILISFLVLCVVLSTALRYAELWRKPLGFDWHDVWQIQIGGVHTGLPRNRDQTDANDSIYRLRRAVSGLPEVRAATLMENVPYSGSTMLFSTYVDGQSEGVFYTPAEPSAAEVMQLQIVQGRWLEEADAALEWTPVVIDKEFAVALFGQEDPLDKQVPLYDREGNPREAEDAYEIRRVVGVTEAYRKRGELRPTEWNMFLSVAGGDPEDDVPDKIVLRLQPGTPWAFEERLLETLRGIAPQWSFEVTALEDMRHQVLLEQLMSLIIGSVVAAFLILMVGLGLVGVLWLNVTRRTQEMGLRRALGASGAGVRGQVLGELLAMTTVAVIAGAILYLQAPFLGLLGDVSYPVLLLAVLLAGVLIYSFVTACGLYPSWLATRIEPAEALQYE